IVVTAGMVSTTWVQFIKGSLLVIFCAMLTIAILARGLKPTTDMPEGPVTAAVPSEQVPHAGHVLGVEGEGPGGTGPLGPVDFLRRMTDVEPLQWATAPTPESGGGDTRVFTPNRVDAETLMMPGGHPMFRGIHEGDLADKLDFISLMLALF